MLTMSESLHCTQSPFLPTALLAWNCSWPGATGSPGAPLGGDSLSRHCLRQPEACWVGHPSVELVRPVPPGGGG